MRKKNLFFTFFSFLFFNYTVKRVDTCAKVILYPSGINKFSLQFCCIKKISISFCVVEILKDFLKKMINDLNLLFWIEYLTVIVINNQPILSTLLY